MQFSDGLFTYLFQGLLYSVDKNPKPAIVVEHLPQTESEEYLLLNKIMGSIGYQLGSYDMIEFNALKTQNIQELATSRRFVLYFDSTCKDISIDGEQGLIKCPALKNLSTDDANKRKLWSIIKDYKTS